jgi:hypothetical protein
MQKPPEGGSKLFGLRLLRLRHYEAKRLNFSNFAGSYHSAPGCSHLYAHR